ncbi:MAG: recombination mediator RecR [Gammaproteobacteria bacterium]|nr:recombination mediator RecR [Gammaproteobacteria bacterium]
MYPKSLDDLIHSFMLLPGVGKKSAERYAYYVINKFDQNKIDTFIESLRNVKTKIKRCNICGFFTEGDDTCEFCRDTNRDKSTILVVEEAKDVIAIEKVERYKGLYHVLNGSISPLNGVGPDELNIKSLIERVNSNEIKEVIIATSATVEGEATAMYLSKILSNLTQVSRIAYGMPVGSSLEYSDETTILKALEGRRNI